MYSRQDYGTITVTVRTVDKAVGPMAVYCGQDYGPITVTLHTVDKAVAL